MPIKILDPKVVAQIAAGEVVERPASVVKELVENSLDAGATQISVEVRGGGVSLMRVMDNGSGIPSGEVELAFKRHATSKLEDIEDLEKIESLGFRGEALASIAAVAQVEISTCAVGESAGTYLRLEDGTVAEKRSQGRSQGTTITVRNLFRKVPARLKFLKSTTTENGHIANVVSQYALAFPEVKFSLLMEGKPVLRTPGSGKLIDAILEVYGLEIAQGMLAVDSRNKGWEGGTGVPVIQVTGMVGSPAIRRASRDYLSFFVNRRWIQSRMLTFAVEEAYHGLLMTGKHPVAVINITLPPQQVDVNIHPTKTEVKFQNEGVVFTAVQKAVRQALVESTPVPRMEDVATAYVVPPATASPTKGLVLPAVKGKQSVSSPSPPPQIPLVSLPLLHVLGQFESNYIVAEGPDGLYLVDQHAAHERILFEKIQRERSTQKVEVQGLLEPRPFEMNPREDTVLRLHYQELAEFGFSLEPFGERIYLVRTVPLLLHDKDWAGVLRELLDSRPVREWSESIAISIACHSAVRAGQSLSDDEMRELVWQLSQTSLPHTCPHGRPTVIYLSSGQIKKEFGRT